MHREFPVHAGGMWLNAERNRVCPVTPAGVNDAAGSSVGQVRSPGGRSSAQEQRGGTRRAAVEVGGGNLRDVSAALRL